MELEYALEFRNKTNQPLMLVVEPLGEDYTMLPNDTAYIVPSDEELSSPPYGRPTIDLTEDGAVVHGFFNYEVHFNGTPVQCGHQRPLLQWQTFPFEVILPATPKQIYELWTDAEDLSIALGNIVEKVRNKRQYKEKFLAYDKSIEWTNVTSEPYSRLYQIWRSSEFPGTAPDAHVKIIFEEVEGGTRLLIDLHLLPENFQENYKEFWGKYFFEPMRRYFQDQDTV
jgi:hypothetical protein